MLFLKWETKELKIVFFSHFLHHWRGSCYVCFVRIRTHLANHLDNSGSLHTPAHVHTCLCACGCAWAPRCWQAACHTRGPRLTLLLGFLHLALAWPCELSEKLSKAGRIWEDFKNLAGLAASRIILCDTFIPDPEPQMFDLFPPLLKGAPEQPRESQASNIEKSQNVSAFTEWWTSTFSNYRVRAGACFHHRPNRREISFHGTWFSCECLALPIFVYLFFLNRQCSYMARKSKNSKMHEGEKSSPALVSWSPGVPKTPHPVVKRPHKWPLCLAEQHQP